MALLAGASLVGGGATSPAMLLGARAGQGMAAAMAVAGLSILTTTFAEGPLRARALGLNGRCADRRLCDRLSAGRGAHGPDQLALGAADQGGVAAGAGAAGFGCGGDPHPSA